MFKKILVSALAAIILVAVGASTYTAFASPGEVNTAEPEPVLAKTNSQTVSTIEQNIPDFPNTNPAAEAAASATQIVEPAGNGSGYGNGKGNGGGQAGGSTGTQVNPAEVSTISGVINSYEYSTLTIQTDASETIVVQLGNTTYTESIGFFPQTGERVTVTGFADAQGMFSAITVTLDASGQTYIFRDESGRPLWSGGSRGGNGSGNGNGRRGN